MHIRHFVLLPALFIASAVFGQGSASSAHADLIIVQGQKIGTALLTQTASGGED